MSTSDDTNRITRLEAASEAHEEHDRERFAEMRDALSELRDEMRTSLGELRADGKSVLEKVQALATQSAKHGVATSLFTGVLTAVLTAILVHFVGGQ